MSIQGRSVLISFQKYTFVDAIDEIMATRPTAQRILTCKLDIAKVYTTNLCQYIQLRSSEGILVYASFYAVIVFDNAG